MTPVENIKNRNLGSGHVWKIQTKRKSCIRYIYKCDGYYKSNLKIQNKIILAKNLYFRDVI